MHIGDTALPDGTVVENVAANDVPDTNEDTSGYVRSSGRNDVAMLTLTAPVDTELTRVVDARDPQDAKLWAPNKAGRVLGWGETSQGGDISESLLRGDVTRRDDAACAGAGFDPAIMLCAAGTAPDNQNPCASDSGSPLLVPDGATFALAGVFSGASCATASTPARFARVGSTPLSKWVHDRTPEADFGFESGTQPRAGVPFALVSTSTHPEGDDYFTQFKWDLDGDGAFDDAMGKRIVMTVGSAGEAIVGIQASRPATGRRPRATPRRGTSASTSWRRRPPGSRLSRPAPPPRRSRRPPIRSRAPPHWPPSSSAAGRRSAAGASRSASASRRARREARP